MSKAPKNPKLRRNAHFRLWLFAFAMFFLIGALWMWTGRIPQRLNGGPDLTGPFARGFGFVVAASCAIGIYRLLFHANRKELAMPGFYELSDFDDHIEGFHVSFRIKAGQLSSGSRGSTAAVFNYILRVKLNEPLNFDFSIRRRDRFEIFLWYVGIERLLDVLTGHRYFDSRYRVRAPDRGDFRARFTTAAITAIERFDRDYPPIRLKNGWLHINRSAITYTEGPYNEQERIFDPHRGKIEETAAQLIGLAEIIQGRNGARETVKAQPANSD